MNKQNYNFKKCAKTVIKMNIKHLRFMNSCCFNKYLKTTTVKQKQAKNMILKIKSKIKEKRNLIYFANTLS